MKRRAAAGKAKGTAESGYIIKRGMARIMILTATDEELEEIIRAAERILNGEREERDILPQ